MNTEAHTRRHTDRGYISQMPDTLTALRLALGLGPVSERLNSLSHWRRSRSASQESGAAA